MKILFLSDIHGISDNLNVLSEIIKKDKIEKMIVLGDLYYPGPNYNGDLKLNSAEVKKFLTSYSENLICMRGNCDSDVDVKASDFPICDGLCMFNIDNLNIYTTHGNEYNIEKNKKFNTNGILVYGHEHIPYIKEKDNMVYINVGSISLPKNGNLPTYLIYENRKFTIYDIEGNVVDEKTI